MNLEFNQINLINQNYNGTLNQSQFYGYNNNNVKNPIPELTINKLIKNRYIILNISYNFQKDNSKTQNINNGIIQVNHLISNTNKIFNLGLGIAKKYNVDNDKFFISTIFKVSYTNPTYIKQYSYLSNNNNLYDTSLTKIKTFESISVNPQFSFTYCKLIYKTIYLIGGINIGLNLQKYFGNSNRTIINKNSTTVYNYENYKTYQVNSYISPIIGFSCAIN